MTTCKMPHHKNECADKCEKDCKKECCVPCCAPDPCDHYSAFEICCKKRPAVVSISSQLATVAHDLTTVPVLGEISYLRLNGNGAFIKLCGRLYILTSSFLVIAPPSLLVTNSRYPRAGTENVAELAPTDLVAFSRILVSVHNLNGRMKPSKKSENGHSIVYEASPAFVDGAGGWALLYIDPCKEWNRCLPKIDCECHPHFDIGKSRQLQCGDDLYLMGNFVGASRPDPNHATSYGITKGIVSNPRAADHTGWLVPELILGDFEAYNPSVGMPIINKFGQLVGVQLTSTPGMVDGSLVTQSGLLPTIGLGAVYGVSSYFMAYGMKTFSVIGSRKHKYECFRRHIASVVDQYHGDYYKYLKGFVGLAYRILESQDYNTRLASGASQLRVPLLQDATSGGLYEGPRCKNLAGIRVENTAGSLPAPPPTANGTQVTYVQVVGAGAAAPFDAAAHQNSNFALSIAPETIITAGERCYFGDQSHQIPPALLTWKYISGDRIGFVARRPAFVGVLASEALIPADNFLRDSISVSGQLQVFPPTYDYPWALIAYFPLPLVVPGDVQVAPGPGQVPVNYPQVMSFFFKSAI